MSRAPSFERVRAALEAKDLRPKENVKGLSALCPAHEDSRASLSVSEGDDGKVLLKCFAGCEVADIAEGLGLTMKDLFPEEPKPPAKKARGKVAKAYSYTDEAGALLFEVVRMDPKDFRQRRPDPSRPGTYLWNLDGVRRVLYRLPDVLAAVRTGGRVYVVEGEKDAEALARLGLTATTNPGGAGKWLPGHSEALRGAHVVILPDTDDPGRKHGEAVAKALHGVAASVRVVSLGRPGVKDPADFIAEGGTREDLTALSDAAPEWSPVALRPLAELLDEIRRRIRRFVVLSPEQATLCALWTVHAHAVDAADATPYLIVTSPERRCGKSRLIEVLVGLAPNPWYAVRPSEAVLFRKLALKTTLFLDEYDTIFSIAAKDSTEGIRATLNAGFQRGAVVSRCADHGKDLLDFEVFGPKVLGGIGDPPDTVRDRGFVLSMRRARRSESRERYRRRKAGPEAEEIRRRIEAWAEVPATIQALKRAEPSLPDALNDRAQDAAEPLLALADLAGGEWPDRARTALVALAGEAAEDEVEDSSGIALLRDLVTVFERLQSPKGATSKTLVGELHEIEGAPWKKWGRGEGLDEIGLSRLLRQYKVRPKKKRWRTGDEPRGGYSRVEILEAADRYVPPLSKDAEDEDESATVPSPEHPERWNETALEAAESVPPPIGTVPGTPLAATAADDRASVRPFRPPFRPPSERLDPHEQRSRSAVPTVPGGVESPEEVAPNRGTRRVSL